MSRTRSAVIATLAGVWLTLAVPAGGQYLFLDVDGDGELTQFDDFTLLRFDPWVIDLYLVTESPVEATVACPNEIYAYRVHLFAAGAPFVVENVENMVSGMTESFPMSAHPYALTLGYERSQPLGPGKFHLLRLTVRFQYGAGILGCPALSIVPSTCYAPEGVFTSASSLCGDDYPIWGTGFYGCSDMTGHAPTITCPPEVRGREGEFLSFQAVAGDPDCGEYPFDFQSGGFPSGAAVTPLSPFRAGEAVQEVTWTPSPGQAGEYIVNFLVQKPDPFNFTDRRSICTTRIVIENGNTAPVADAGGPYTGLTGYPVMMTGAGSQDPEGDELSYSWEFGDGFTGAGETVSHGYSSSGFYKVKLVVSDGVLYDEDGTTALIVDALGFDVFVTGGDRTLRLDSGKPLLCVSAEGKDFPIEYADLSSLEMVYGSSSIPAAGEKTSLGGDRNRNGKEEITACFAKDDLRRLFAGLPTGTNDVIATIRARHQAGNPISGDFALTVVVRSSLSLSVMPHPLNPHGTITFTKAVPGMTRIHLLDVSGRLVRTILESDLGIGVHSISFHARDRAGSPLASGVYFLRISDQEGMSARRVVIAK